MFSTTSGTQIYKTPSSSFPKIMFCGDSITYANGGTSGFGAYKQHVANRFKTLYGWYPRAGVDIVGGTNNNACSYPMCGTSGIKADQLNSTYLPPDLVAYSPTHCFIHIGTNDILNGQTTATILGRYGNCLDTIRAALPTCKVTLCKIIDRNSYTTQVNDLNSGIDAFLSARSDLSYLSSFDMNALLGSYSVVNYNDDTHPNDVGYKIMGNGVGDYFYSIYPNG